MDALSMLTSTEPSLLIVEVRTRSDIVVGVPHHAPAGVAHLPCPEHSDADENTGFIGRHLADRIDCCSVIACNYTIDANKHLDSDYAQQIAAWQPTILIEIHGHGKVRSSYDVEISCGSAAMTVHSERLAGTIQHRISQDADFDGITVCGRFSDLYFKATKSLTITDMRWLAYHIELSPRLRKPGNSRVGMPTPLAFKFCDHLSKALSENHA